MTKKQYLAAATAHLASAIRRFYLPIKERHLDRLAADIVNGRMSSEPITREALAALIDGFSAGMPKPEHRDAADAVLAALIRYRQLVFKPEEASKQASEPPRKIPVAAMRSGPFFGMGIRDAAFEVLKREGKKTAREIWEILEAGGFTSAHENPAHAVHSGLAKRARMQKDVFLVGEGKWDLCKNYPEEERARITASLNSQAGRDPLNHRANTVAGMQVAKARGARLGPKKMLEPDQLAKIEEMVRSGTSVAATARAFGVSPGTIYNSITRERIADLREEAENLKEKGVPPDEVRH